MAHVAKYPKGSTGQLCQHYERKQKEKEKDKDKVKYIKFGNQDIDLTKTHENYNLAPDREQGQVKFIRERCNELNCLNRSDVKVMASWVVTLPKEFPVEQEKQFFEQTYKFLENRYGEKNVVSAYVHKDENQPHMHFAFVPVVYDKKKGKEKVSAKECITKKDLQTFHKEFSNHMEKHFGRDVGILNERTREGNKSIEELKRQSATERLNEVREKAEEIITLTHAKSVEMMDLAKKEVEKSSKRVKSLLEKEKEIENKISSIDKMEVKKGLFGSYTLKEKDYKDLLTLAKHGARVDELENQLKISLKNYSELNAKYQKETGIEILMERAKEDAYTKNLEKENRKLKEFICVEDLQYKFSQFIKKNQNQNRSGQSR